MTVQRCVVCNELVESHETAGHLATQHAAPESGFRFFFESKPFFSKEPSMLVADLMKLVGDELDFARWLAEDVNGKTVTYSGHNAVDLTREPRFYILLGAYMG